MGPAGIALLHYTCPPFVGGVEEILDQQARVFLDHGHPVKVLAGRGGRMDGAYLVEINPFLDSRHPSILRIQRSIPDHRSEFRALVDALFRYLQHVLEGLDVLIAHNVLTMAYNLPLAHALHQLADAQTTRIVAWNHDSPLFYPDPPAELNRTPWNILKRSHPSIRYIAISESRKKQFQSLYGRKTRIEVIPDGIDRFRFYEFDSQTLRIIQECQLLESDLLMLQPSRLHPRKNIELSIRVLRALHDRGVKARLLVTGAYDAHENKATRYYNKLRGLARSLEIDEYLLILAGHDFRSGEKPAGGGIKVKELYFIADVLFLPSLHEGFGLPLLEAGLAKLPVFCSDIPPFIEIGENDISTFGLGDPPEQIAAQLLDFAARPGCLPLSRRVIRQYDWDKIYHSFLRPLICDLVARP
ncbi:MAG: hypothetical protein A2W03_18580 [Candidatus Aminicenantes bacterium RBG_16_63_16]|nr:MAG: hypothetical protein A2W03_18580 [Candidatus Aminicenantes bacterium RBG_16_63_16]